MLSDVTTVPPAYVARAATAVVEANVSAVDGGAGLVFAVGVTESGGLDSLQTRGQWAAAVRGGAPAGQVDLVASIAISAGGGANVGSGGSRGQTDSANVVGKLRRT